MIIGASQPTFLPYPGYFGLIDFVDKFIFMDNVQFNQRSWQQRNYIKFNYIDHMLTVPVLKKNKREQLILDVEIDVSSNYVNKHLKTIERAYKKSKYFDSYFPIISKVYNKNFKFLLDLNSNLIKVFLEILGISKSIIFLSSLKIENYKNAELIYKICESQKCETYVSTIGSKSYLNNYNKIFEKYNVKFFIYNNATKFELDNSHQSSIIDLIFNEGPESLKKIRSNFKII
jgi:hypothetical protein